MTKYDYSKLQNGSDIRGIALDGVAGETINLDAQVANRLAKGFLLWLSNKTGKMPAELKIAMGRDPRLSGADLASAFGEALMPHGVTVLDAGLASTPAMFMSTLFPEYKCDGAVMITASHLPFNRNGFKFFDINGGLNNGDITDIIVFAGSNAALGSLSGIPLGSDHRIASGTGAGKIEKIPLLDTYCTHLRQLIIAGVCHGQKPLLGMKIAVDAGNGAGGFYADKVLAPLGADVSSSQFLNPDGNFPNHTPNPEDEAAMGAICSAVVNASADLGLIFDTDVDRSSAVDEKGKDISRNGIIAMAASLIAGQFSGTTVVTDSITSTQLTDFLEGSLGLHHLRFKRGYKNVINKSVSLNDSGVDSQLAIETSGHAAYKENYFLDDGAYLATKIVIKAAELFRGGKGISSIIADLNEPAESVEIRFPILTEEFGPYADKVIEGLTTLVAGGCMKGCTLVEPNYEGIRIAFHTPSLAGWMLLRKSLHDPIMPLNIESDVAGGCDEIRRMLRPILAEYGELDISKL